MNAWANAWEDRGEETDLGEVVEGFIADTIRRITSDELTPPGDEVTEKARAEMAGEYAHLIVGYELSGLTVVNGEGVSVRPMLAAIGFDSQDERYVHLMQFEMTTFKSMYKGMGEMLGALGELDD